MNRVWDAKEAKAYEGGLGMAVYTSCLFGKDKALVLVDVGNISVKIVEENIFSGDKEILYAKGSEWDLAKIKAAGSASRV